MILSADSAIAQVAEGVSTAAAVVGLGRKYRVALPVLTAVAQVFVSLQTFHSSDRPCGFRSSLV